MRSEGDFVKRFGLFLVAAISWIVLNVASELMGDQANDSPIGKTVAPLLWGTAVFGVPALVVVWLVIALVRRRSARRVKAAKDAKAALPAQEPETDQPPPIPLWRGPSRLYSRRTEVARAVQLVGEHCVVVIAGPHDIGTSTVANGVVAGLAVDDPKAGVWFDLRGRSSQRADDARTTAGRLLAPFGLDEPADDSPQVLASAARRLIAAFRRTGQVLVLDNVSVPEQVRWLVDEWPVGGPVLVVAGESAIGDVFEHTVHVGELDIEGMRAIWDAELASSEPRRDWLRQMRERRRDGGQLDELLAACWGRPRAVEALAREVGRRDSRVTVEGLVAALRSDRRVDGVLERVWAAMLDNAKEGLSADAAWLLHGLAELPVTGLSSFAIAGILAEHRGAAAEDALGPLEELRIRNLVQETDDGYRLPSEIRAAVTRHDADRATYARAAVPALVRYAVKVTEDWLVKLRSGPRSKPAERWFQNAERSLWPLFSEQTYQDPELLTATIDDLARIADALEEWYMREQQAKGLLTVNHSLANLASLADREDLAALAAIRKAAAHRMMGNTGDARAMLDTAARRRSGADPALRGDLELREHVEWALLSIANSDTEGMETARDQLTRIARRSRTPDRLRRTVEINLGVLHLLNGKPQRALRHVRIAERLAADSGDKGCKAHAIELQGVGLSQVDSLLAAVRQWEHARDLFAEISDEQGEARCLQHLGSAALVDPDVASLLRDGKRHPLNARACAEVALPLLERSKDLRAGQPDTHLVDDHLADAYDRLR